MNYIGLIFSFMLPGMVIGFMAGCIWAARERRRAKKRHVRCHRPVCDWNEFYVGDR